MPNVKTLPQTINKSAVLAQIRAAKSAHMRWRAYAQAMISGVEISGDKLPVKHMDCSFGKWYYGRGQVILGHLASYDAIAAPHEMLHAVYERIYQILQGDGQGALHKLLRSKKTLETEKYAQAREHLEELIGVSDTLLKAMEMLEQEIRDTAL